MLMRNIVGGLPVDSMLTRSFRLQEFFVSETASRLGLDNWPPAQEEVAVVRNLELLCEHILQPLRDYAVTPLVVTSGYRSAVVNANLHGKPTSQHCLGQAADIHANGMPNDKLADMIKEMRLPFDQLILEYYTPTLPYSGWVHVSYVSNGGRQQVLEIGPTGTRVA